MKLTYGTKPAGFEHDTATTVRAHSFTFSPSRQKLIYWPLMPDATAGEAVTVLNVTFVDGRAFWTRQR